MRGVSKNSGAHLNMSRFLIVTADGGSRGNPGQAAYGAVVYENDKVLAEVSGKLGVATNNVAEYQGLIAGLKAAHEIDANAKLEVRLDSKLVVEQMSGNWKIRHPEMLKLAQEARSIHAHELIDYLWIPRESNSHADRLVNEALDGIISSAKEPVRLNYLTERLISNEVPTTVYLVRHGETPLTPFRKFSGDGPLNPGLTAKGLIEAELVAHEIKKISPDILITSPLQRAKQTASVISKATGVKLLEDPIWIECSFGDWDGMSIEEVNKKYPEEYAEWLASTSYAPPRGESYESAMARAVQGLLGLVGEYPGKKICVVTHNGIIKTALTAAMKVDTTAIFNIDVSPCSISAISIWPSDNLMAIRSTNERGHLRD
jgi:broad specificity phosphatase PhoE/ribonuclease HI